MNITADTNVLIRAAVNDDLVQSPLAVATLRNAATVAVTLPALCEFVWVLRRWYKLAPDEVAGAIRQLIASGSVQSDRPAIEAGLEMLDRNGDFADGVIAFEGRRLGGTVFASFDVAACALVEASGGTVQRLAALP